MRRSHRKVHAAVWAILGPMVLLGLWLGISARTSMPVQAPPVVDELPSTNPPALEVLDK